MPFLGLIAITEAASILVKFRVFRRKIPRKIKLEFLAYDARVTSVAFN